MAATIGAPTNEIVLPRRGAHQRRAEGRRVLRHRFGLGQPCAAKALRAAWVV
jgi:hypothetical protein